MKYALVLFLGSLLVSNLVFGDDNGTGFAEVKALEVKLISIGSGIDDKAEDRILSKVKGYLKERDLTQVTSKNWGKEGERTLCLEFKDDVTAAERSKEIEKIAAKANKKHKMVLIEGKLTCVDDKLDILPIEVK